MKATASVWQCSTCWKHYMVETTAEQCCTCDHPGCGAGTNAPWVLRCDSHTTVVPHHDHRAKEVARRDLGLVEAFRSRDAEGLALGIKLPEAAKLLGISQRHLYNQVRAGQVPSYRVGKALRFSPVALREWVARQSANSVAWQSADPGKRVPQITAEFAPAPKTVHVRRAGGWVTELPSTFVE